MRDAYICVFNCAFFLLPFFANLGFLSVISNWISTGTHFPASCLLVVASSLHKSVSSSHNSVSSSHKSVSSSHKSVSSSRIFSVWMLRVPSYSKGVSICACFPWLLYLLMLLIFCTQLQVIFCCSIRPASPHCPMMRICHLCPRPGFQPPHKRYRIEPIAYFISCA